MNSTPAQNDSTTMIDFAYIFQKTIGDFRQHQGIVSVSPDAEIYVLKNAIFRDLINEGHIEPTNVESYNVVVKTCHDINYYQVGDIILLGSMIIPNEEKIMNTIIEPSMFFYVLPKSEDEVVDESSDSDEVKITEPYMYSQ